MTLLWDTFTGTKATEYGNNNEPICAKVYDEFPNTSAESSDSSMAHFYMGLNICQDEPWLDVSPDKP
jgi:hypothetical protein